MATYRGLVIDRMGDNSKKTIKYPTWEAAHEAAEKLAKRHGIYHSDRWYIDVEDIAATPQEVGE